MVEYQAYFCSNCFRQIIPVVPTVRHLTLAHFALQPTRRRVSINRRIPTPTLYTLNHYTPWIIDY